MLKKVNSRSDRILATPSLYGKSHLLYVQEVGSLESIEQHISKRSNLDSYLILLVTKGSGKITIQGTPYHLNQGDCAWIDCNTSYSHESSFSNPWCLQWVHFNGVQTKSFYSTYIEENSPVFHPDNFSLFSDCITNLYQIHKKKESLYELIANRELTNLVTLCYVQNKEHSLHSTTTPEKISQIHSYLEEHFTDDIHLDKLAERFFVSKFYMSREYKKAFGVTIGNDLTERRVTKAKYLLRFTTDSIEDISMESGFGSAGYFIRVFKQREGMTPLAYRKKW